MPIDLIIAILVLVVLGGLFAGLAWLSARSLPAFPRLAPGSLPMARGGYQAHQRKASPALEALRGRHRNFGNPGAATQWTPPNKLPECP